MHCKGSGSQSWADVSSSSPTYSNVDVDAVYASQETDSQETLARWSQTQSNFDSTSQNNYFDYYQGQGLVKGMYLISKLINSRIYYGGI